MPTQKENKQQIHGLTAVKIKDIYSSFSKTPKTVTKKANKDIDKEKKGEPHLSSQVAISGNLSKGKLEYDEDKAIDLIYYAWNGWNFIGAKGESNRDVYNGNKPKANQEYTLYDGYQFWDKEYPGNFNKVYGVSKLKKSKIVTSLELVRNLSSNSDEKEAIEDLLENLENLLKKKSGTIGQSLPYRWQAHHVLPMSAFTSYFESDDIDIICRSDYDINAGSNIIFLPSVNTAMKYHQLPGHWTDHPQYTDKVKSEFKKVQDKLDEIKEEDEDHEKSAPKYEHRLKDIESDMYDLLVKLGPKELHLVKKDEF